MKKKKAPATNASTSSSIDSSASSRDSASPDGQTPYPYTAAGIRALGQAIWPHLDGLPFQDLPPAERRVLGGAIFAGAPVLVRSVGLALKREEGLRQGRDIDGPGLLGRQERAGALLGL